MSSNLGRVFGVLLPSLSLSLSLAGCASSDLAGAEESAASISAAAPAAATTRFLGQVDVDGAKYTVEVEMTIDQVVEQTRTCIVDDDDRDVWAYVSHDTKSGALVTRTIVRRADGAILAEGSTSTTIRAGEVVESSMCSADGTVLDRGPRSAIAASGLVWINGVAADVPGGPIWVNGGYGAPGREFAYVRGQASFVQTEAIGASVPVGHSPGERLTVGRGNLTIDIDQISVGEDQPFQDGIQLTIGIGVQGTPFGHPARTEKVLLKRQ